MLSLPTLRMETAPRPAGWVLVSSRAQPLENLDTSEGLPVLSFLLCQHRKGAMPRFLHRVLVNIEGADV